MQTVLLGSSSGAIVEFVIPEAGNYVMVDHHFANASQGTVGIIAAGGRRRRRHGAPQYPRHRNTYRSACGAGQARVRVEVPRLPLDRRRRQARPRSLWRHQAARRPVADALAQITRPDGADRRRPRRRCSTSTSSRCRTRACRTTRSSSTSLTSSGPTSTCSRREARSRSRRRPGPRCRRRRRSRRRRCPRATPSTSDHRSRSGSESIPAAAFAISIACSSPPRSRVIGASDRAGSVGATVWRNLRAGALRRADLRRQPQARNARRGAVLRPARRSAAGAGSGGDLHAAGDRPGADRRAGPARHARGHRHDRRPRRRAEAGDARRRAALPAAHPRPELHRPADAPPRPQCQLRAHRRAAPATWPSSRSRARWSRRCSTGHSRAASASRHSSRWASAPTSTSATCSITWRAMRTRARSCCTSNRSRRRASSCRRRARRRATSR